MKSGLAEEVFARIDARTQTGPTPMEFEMAYQARVAIDRIKFAIKHTEQFGPRTDQMREVGLQLLDALQRLEAADRRFQARCQMPVGYDGGDNHRTREAHEKTKAGPLQQANGRTGRRTRDPEHSD
jgi:hypothetical protein